MLEGVSANFLGLESGLKVSCGLGRTLESRSAKVWGSGSELSGNQVEL